MAIEAFPLVTSTRGNNSFSTVEQASESINQILSKGEYVGHIAVSAGKGSGDSNLDQTQKGIIFFVRLPENGND